MNMRCHISFLLITICLQIQTAFANVKPNSIFSDHMVLQQGAAIPVWGTAADGEPVTVYFNGQSVTTQTKNGKWMVKLAPLPYITHGIDMTIAGADTIVIKDILVGEVWLCSGQSNMERQLGPRPPQHPITNWENERDAANYPLIREFYVPLKYAQEKIDDVNGRWTVCSPQTVADFTAVGYLFSKNLYNKIKVPVGIVFSAFGGTPAEDWTSEAALKSQPELAEFVANYTQLTTATWHPQGQCMNGLYNGMIYPLLPYAIKGVAWYQGESNNGRAAQYPVVLSNMIRNWRTDFAQGDFPFLIVQIAPHKDMLPEIREAQLKIVQTVPNTALVVTIDCGDSADIHPTFKQPVGERLALAARAMAYKEKIEYSGPVYRSFAVKGNTIVLQFDHVAKGLVAGNKNDKLMGFTIAGADGQFVPAEATIKGKKIIVSSTSVANPVAVRYGWSNVPHGNLYNTAGLPASPFRTDNQ